MWICAGADCENENGNAPAQSHEESHQAGTSTPNQMLVAQDLISGSCPNEGQCTLEHTRPGEILPKESMLLQ